MFWEGAIKVRTQWVSMDLLETIGVMPGDLYSLIEEGLSPFGFGLMLMITMASDYSESVHHGLVELGGFTRLTDLTPDERRCMYNAERANLVSRNTWVQITT